MKILRNNRRQLPSIYTTLLVSFCFVLLFLMVLFSVSTMAIFSLRINANINSLLDRSLIVAWQEYNRFFKQNQHLLLALAGLEEVPEFFIKRNAGGFAALLNSQNDLDFWLALDNQGRAIATSAGETGNLPVEITNLCRGTLQVGHPFSFSEIVPAGTIALLQPGLASRALIELRGQDGRDGYFSEELIQVVGVPVKKDDQILGCLVAGRLLNNDEKIAGYYSQQIPGSYLSIGVRGVRIAANIESYSLSGPDFVGIRQAEDLVTTTGSGRRYFGQAQIEPGDIHLVASDPIYNSRGEIIGDLSVGIPSQGITTVKRDTFLAILVSLAISLLLALAVAAFLSRRIARPITIFSHLAREISQEETVTLEHVEQMEDIRVSDISEIWFLQRCFNRMARSLHQKCKETEAYLEELERDRHQLRHLADELTEANSLLEKRVEERTGELRRAVTELKALNHLKTQFLANMSHELRTPLNSIIGFSEMLADELFGKLNPTQKEYVEIILKSSRHLLQVISDILDLARIEQGRIVLNRETVPLEDLIQAVATIIRPQALANNLRFNLDVQHNIPPLYIDTLRIKQVLYNLLTNAIKFTPPGGEVILKARLLEGEVMLAVKDTGIGIKEEDQHYVFDEFYQCGSLYQRKFEGVGLGLPLSKKLVELHGGRIELRSIYGEGTEVTFYLPVSDGEKEAGEWSSEKQTFPKAGP